MSSDIYNLLANVALLLDLWNAVTQGNLLYYLQCNAIVIQVVVETG